MKKSLLILCMTLASVMHAQNPGYMGKHWMVYAITDIAAVFEQESAAVDNYESYAGVSLNPAKFRVGMFPGIGTEYTISKSVTMGANFRYVVLHNSIQYYNNNESNMNRPTLVYGGETRIQSMMYGGYLKFHPFYKKGVIAPIGRYHQFEIISGKQRISNGDYYTTDPELMDYLASLTSDGFSATDHTIVSDVSELGFPDISYAYFRYTFGGQTVIHDRYPVDLGMYINYPADLLAIAGSESSFYYSHSNEMLNSLAIGFTFRIGFFVL